MQTYRYQILLQGFIDENWSSYLGGMTVTPEPDGVTRLTGNVADQSALSGLLDHIRDLNLGLISVQLLGNDGVTPVACRYCRPRPSAPGMGRVKRIKRNKPGGELS